MHRKLSKNEAARTWFHCFRSDEILLFVVVCEFPTWFNFIEAHTHKQLESCSGNAFILEHFCCATWTFELQHYSLSFLVQIPRFSCIIFYLFSISVSVFCIARLNARCCCIFSHHNLPFSRLKTNYKEKSHMSATYRLSFIWMFRATKRCMHNKVHHFFAYRVSFLPFSLSLAFFSSLTFIPFTLLSLLKNKTRNMRLMQIHIREARACCMRVHLWFIHFVM